MNPAALETNVKSVRTGGIVIVNEDEFDKVNLRKAGFAEGYNPIDDEKYSQRFQIYRVPVTRLNQDALKGTGGAGLLYCFAAN